MTKTEFEKLLGPTTQFPTQQEYDIIEKVYTWHPSISNTKGKKQVAMLYDNFGITIFYDMLGRSEKVMELKEEVRKAKAKLSSLEIEMEELAKGKEC